MRLITVEEHYNDQRIVEANAAFEPERPAPPPHLAADIAFMKARSFPEEKLLDFEKYRLPFMDENGIDVQVLSYTFPFSDHVPAAEQVEGCRLANDISRAILERYPGRFEAFATVPMADPVAAGEELRRCVEDLGMCGTLLAGRYKGRFFNEPEFFPIYEAATQCGVPVSFHPAFIPREVQDAYYMSDAYSFIVGSELACAGIGWHFETGMQAVRLIMSGTFDKLPELKIISGHWGEMIPAYLERVDERLDKELTGLERQFSEYYKDHVYLSSSGILSHDQLGYMVKLMGADHIMFSIDYPYILPSGSKEFLIEADLTDEERELIAHGTAEKLLGI